MKRSFDPLALAGLTSEQWGLVTTRQAELAGVSAQQMARLAMTGTLERMQHGVYRIASNPPDRRDRIRAAWLALEPQTPATDRLSETEPGVLSHRSAAVAHALGDLEADTVEFTVPTRRQTRSPGVRFHVKRLDRDDWALVDGLPVTTILTTIGDLAADKLDTGHLAGVVRDALATHHLAFDDVATVLRSYAHHYAAPLGDGSQMVERLLDEAGVPASTIRLGEYALNPSRQPGATLVDTSALNASVARAMEPLLHSQALTDAVRRMHETLGSAAAAIDTSQLRTPEMDVLNASVARAMEPLLQSTAIEESMRRIQEVLGTAAAAAFPNAVLRAITDHVTAQQSPARETLTRAITANNATATGVAGGVGPTGNSSARSAVTTDRQPVRKRTAAAPKKAKPSTTKRSQPSALTSAQ